MPRIYSLLVLLCCASLGLADHQLQTLSNKTIKGKVVAITDQSVKMMDAEGKVSETPLSQVLAIELRPAGDLPVDAMYTILQLFESRLYCNNLNFKGNNIQATLLSGQNVTIPLNQVISFLRSAENKDVREQWEKLMAKVEKNDRVLVLNKGVLEAVPGQLGDVDPDGKKIQLRLDGGNIIPVTLEKVNGLIFYRFKAPVESPACIVYDTMGNKLAAKEITVKGDNFIITTPAGAKITFAEKALAKLDYNRGKLIFLSDLDPVDEVHKSGIGLVIGMKYRRDTNLDGEPILLGKAKSEHGKGLSLHAYTELEYNLDGKFKDFKAVLGVDARAKTESKATVTFFCDGVQVSQEKVDSEKTIPVSLNVRNVQKLRIVVSSEDILNLHDQATLADARISQ